METLYLIQSGKYLKIGITKNLKNRLKLYKTYNPDVTLLATREGTHSDEYFLHKITKSDVNEWVPFKQSIITTFLEVKLNHKDTIKNSNDKKRKKRLKEMIKRKAKLKEANTKIIRKVLD